jgi:3-deoxy-D-manno-octulosonic-acid transferase
MIRHLYNFILHLLSPILLGLTYKHCHKHPKFKLPNCWAKRRGINASLETGGIWIHAASTGETRSVFPLLEKFAKLQPNAPITLTNTSLNGAEQAHNFVSNIALQKTMLPIDYPIYVKRFLKQLKPKVLIVMETELWPNLFYYCHKYNIKIFLLNTRLTDKSFKNYHYFSFGKIMFQQVHWMGLQSERDRQKLLELGVDDNKIVVIGNLKSIPRVDETESNTKKQLENWRQKTEFCWVGGSVHHDEVDYLLQAHLTVKKTLKKNSLLILVPRKPAEFKTVISTVQDFCAIHKLNTVVYSEDPSPCADIDILVLDVMGALCDAYTIATAAFVGGSLCPHGGHNILEPAVYSVPIISGKYFYDQLPIFNPFIENKAITICENSTELSNALIQTTQQETDSQAKKRIKKSLEEIRQNNAEKLKIFWKQLEPTL